MILIVTGSRLYTHRNQLFDSLSIIDESNSIEIMFSGNYPKGADKFCEQWAMEKGRQLVLIPAPWNSPDGVESGFIRNSFMLGLAVTYADEMGSILRLAAFPTKCTRPSCRRKGAHWTHGTEDCWDKATMLGIRGKYFADETLA